MEDQEKIWTAEEAEKITDLDRELVRRRAQRLGIVGKRGGNHRNGPAILYSDEDLQRIKEYKDQRGRQQNAKKK